MSDQTDCFNTALAGRYRIERHLGEGGMASVYLAEDLRHDRKVALKLLKPAHAESAEVAERLGIRARAANAMNVHDRAFSVPISAVRYGYRSHESG